MPRALSGRSATAAAPAGSELPLLVPNHRHSLPSASDDPVDAVAALDAALAAFMGAVATEDGG
jgi:hypothetical protein